MLTSSLFHGKSPFIGKSILRSNLNVMYSLYITFERHHMYGGSNDEMIYIYKKEYKVMLGNNLHVLKKEVESIRGEGQVMG